MPPSNDLVGFVKELLNQYHLIILLLGYYLPHITLMTSIVSAVIATLPLTLYGEALAEEHWLKYFGWAFVVFALQYLPQWVATLIFGIDLMAESQNSLFEWTKIATHSLCSPANNLLFLASARALLNVRRHCPWWAWGAAAVSAIFSMLPLLDYPENWWVRFPDAIFSASVLATLGWAMFTNIDPQWRILPWSSGLPAWTKSTPGRGYLLTNVWRRWRKWMLAWVIFLGSIIYAALNMVYMFNPVFANWFDFESEIDIKVADLQAYDATVFALAFLLKLILFMGASFLIVRSFMVLSPIVVHNTLRGVTHESLEYLSSEGIVATIAKSLDADAVQLYLKIPGHLKKKMAWWCWCNEPDPSSCAKKRIVTEMPEKSTVAGRVISKGKLYNSRTLDSEDLRWNQPIDSNNGDLIINSVIAVPIRYHGSVIAGLNIGWEQQHSMTATSVQRIQLIADLLAPAVEARRELSALYYLGMWFQRQELVLPDRTEDAAIRRLTKIIHPTLSPIATGVASEIGFRATYSVRNDRTSKNDILPEGKSYEKCAIVLDKYVAELPPENVHISDEPLTVEGVEVGRIFLAEQMKDDDENRRPSLVSDWLLKDTVAMMLADAIFDATRVRLWGILNKLQIELNRRGSSSIADWFRVVDSSAREAGVVWAVADCGSQKGFFGPNQAIELIGRLPDSPRKISESIEHLKLSNPQDETRHVVRLKMTPESQIYFGISRSGFGVELRPNWPWVIFLDRFAVAAGASLTRIEVTLLRDDELHRQGLVTASVITGSLVHQLGNMATSLTYGAHSLKQAARMGKIQAEPGILDKIEAMSDVIRRLKETTASIADATKMDDRRPCRLIEAAQRAGKLFTQILTEKDIQLKIDIEENFQIDMPLYIPSLAIANLVSNSIDAIVKFRTFGGRIDVTAEDYGGIIHCHLIDNGPGIKSGLEKKIFDLNVSTKKGSSGLGLYLARRSLRENGGDLMLRGDTEGRGAAFTMILPKRRPGELNGETKDTDR